MFQRTHPPKLASPIEVDGRRIAIPTKVQYKWHDMEIGTFIHFAPNTWQDSEGDTLKTPLSELNPERLDTDQWARAAKAMGAKYLVFVAKHQGGFCWWQTDTTDYSVKNTPWKGGKGDAMKDVSASCKKHGLGLGVYLSPRDDYHGANVGGRAKDPAKQADYERLYRRQLTELLSNYGDMMEVWFDGSLVFDVGDILEKHAPNAVIFQGPQATIRWVGNEDGYAPYPAWNSVRSGAKKWGDYTAADGDPDGDRWLPNECDARIRNTWFWRTDNEKTLKSLDALMEMYYRSVGHGGVFLLNHTPDPTGLIPEADYKRGEEMGNEIKRLFSSPLATKQGARTDETLLLRGKTPIGHIVLMEEIARGERIRRYALEVRAEGHWQTIAEGTAIGHKRIHRFDNLEADAIRLRLVETLSDPMVRLFQAHPLLPKR